MDMSSRQAGSVLQYLNQFLGLSAGSADSDAQLLQRFAGWRDEAAFAELVRRHGRIVWDCVPAAAAQDQDAEDAFQATYLILADKAEAARELGWKEGPYRAGWPRPANDSSSD